MEAPCLEKFSFAEISLLILSNVLLDVGQIGNIEKEYLKANRPSRNNKNYYAACGEKPENSNYESWRMYGNQTTRHNGFILSRYGNQRKLPEVLEFNKLIANAYQNLESTKDFNYPIVTNSCLMKILAVENYFKPYLLEILNKHDKYFRANYASSKYAKEITFAEYFIWVYHILYSQVTEKLINKGLITIPKEKVSFYVFQP